MGRSPKLFLWKQRKIWCATINGQDALKRVRIQAFLVCSRTNCCQIATYSAGESGSFVVTAITALASRNEARDRLDFDLRPPWESRIASSRFN